MPAITLNEYAKGLEDPVSRAVVELYAASSDVLGAMPWKTTGGPYQYTLEGSLPGIAFRGINESYTADYSIENPQVEQLFIAGGEADVDNFLLAMDPSRRAREESRKIKSMARAVTNAIISGDNSATGDIEDFNTGTGLETDAIIERVGRETSLGLRHFGSTEQLLLFTEAGVYYVPEQVAAPLSPTNFELLKIGPEAAADPQPLLVSEGMMFIERDSGRAMICLPTGNVRRSWEIADLSELAFHLMGTPVEMELYASGTESDRLVPVLRDDGQLAVLTYRRNAQFSAWGLWTTTGAWRSLVVADGTLFVCAERVINGVTVFRLERFDETAWGDGMVSLANLTTPAPLYAGQVVGVWDGTSKIGEYAVDGAGLLVGVDSSYGAVRIGLDFTVTVESVPPIDQQMGLRPNYKITRVDVDVVESVGFKGNGRDPSGWTGASVGGAVTPTTSVRRFRPMGRAKYPTFTIEQTIGGPLEVRSLTMEVTS